MSALVTMLLAVKIADEAARSDLECLCAFVQDGGDTADHRWCDTSCVAEDGDGFVRDALAYLWQRGLLDRHPTHDHLVRPRSPAEVIDASR
jgi:hypothetical protein